MKLKLPNGREIQAVDIDFKSASENWNEYHLEDGTVLKFKTIVTGIIRTEDFDVTTGDPIYHVRSTNIIKVKVPEKLKLHSHKVKEGGMEVG